LYGFIWQVENNKNVNVRRINFAMCNGKYVFLSDCFNLDCEVAASFRIVRKEVDGFGIAKRDGGLDAAFQQLRSYEQFSG